MISVIIVSRWRECSFAIVAVRSATEHRTMSDRTTERFNQKTAARHLAAVSDVGKLAQFRSALLDDLL